MADDFDLVVSRGRLFDGLGSPSALRDLGIRGGSVVEISEAPLPIGPATRHLDARGCWVTPGFIDCHTHYDAEVELAPALSESVRHGVTTVTLGSCSLSLAVGTPEDLADMFCRVEAIPYDVVRSVLDRSKTWSTSRDYLDHLTSLPLGPHIASFAGHSALRAHAMGIERSLDRRVRPREDELVAMERLLAQSLDEGYLGLSIQTLPWDKMGGDRPLRSRPLPSCFARWSEYRRLARQLRDRGRVLQGVPNITTKANIALFLLVSAGLFRRPLKTTVISMMDVRSNPILYRVAGLLSRFANRLLGADFRWQALPEIFEVWADGIDLVVFEEFGAGAAALHLQDAVARAKLFSGPAYRDRFLAQWTSPFLPRVFHRDFNRSTILAAPDAGLVGKSFTEVGRERGLHAAEAFLDLVAEHGTALRWYTVIANDRPGPLEKIVSHPDVLIGFSDAGAHLRQMAHYNFPLRMLRLVREAERRGRPVMSVERAVHRLTGEIGGWLGLDAGTLARGRRADLAIIDPEGLDESLERVEEAPVQGFDGGFQRMVRRNDRAVRAVVVNGKLAVENGQPLPALGVERGFGGVLRAQP